MNTPFWLIYSYWSFALTVLWYFKFILWSPLLSAVVSLAASATLALHTGRISETNIFIILTHSIPVWILRNTQIDVIPNILVFTLYNAVLAAYGTNSIQIYNYIYNHLPPTISEYLKQRFTF